MAYSAQEDQAKGDVMTSAAQEDQAKGDAMTSAAQELSLIHISEPTRPY